MTSTPIVSPTKPSLSQLMQRGTSILLYGSCQSTMESIIQTYIRDTRSQSFTFTQCDSIQEPLLDVVLLNSCESSIKIDAIKDIQRRVHHGASQSLPCMVIITRANKLTIQASNALLKILEEPPENTIFLLTCQNKHGVLPTLLSRTLHVFCPTTHSDMIQALGQLPEPMVSAKALVAMSPFNQITTIQSLSSTPTELSDTLYFWFQDLLTDLYSLTKKEQCFLEKIIDIIPDIPYNLNLKLQIIAALIEIGKED